MNKEYNDKAIKARNQIVKNPRWDKEKEAYICQHCGEEVGVIRMSQGYDCGVCGLPIHER